jgi:hypothetical protein
MNMDASFYVFGPSYKSTRLHGVLTPEDHDMNVHCRENLKFYVRIFVIFFTAFKKIT